MKIYTKPNKFNLNDIVVINKINKAGRVCAFQSDVMYDQFAKCDTGTYLYTIHMTDGKYVKFLESALQLAPILEEEQEETSKEEPAKEENSIPGITSKNINDLPVIDSENIPEDIITSPATSKIKDQDLAKKKSIRKTKEKAK